VVIASDGRFQALAEQCAFEEPSVAAARRAIVLMHVTRVADSCGYGVPLMSLDGERPHANAWAEKKVRVGGAEALLDYQRVNNSSSLDGLPAIELDPSQEDPI
jgi:hypothetical protein